MLLRDQLFIGGAWVAPSGRETIEVHNAGNGQVMGRVPLGDVKDVERAVAAARSALDSWSATPPEQRSQFLERISVGLKARADELARLIAQEVGMPLKMSARIQAGLPIANFLNYSKITREFAFEQRVANSLVVRDPVGVVAAITPWNYPLHQIALKVAPALAAGCTVVHKPAEWSPLTATLLSEICLDAGLPPGVLNTVHGFGEDAGKALTEHPDIKAIGFVGESATGSAIMAQGSATLKRVHFELGGKNPVIVFADADLDRALDAVLFMIYSLNGERCTSSSRALVEASIYDAFSKRAAERMKKIKVGHPLDPATEIGPLIHPRHVDKVLSYLKAAQSEGATIVGGGRTGETGNFVNPTLYLDARNTMRIAQEEIFGPVLTMMPFADEQEALAIANDVRYGLAAYLWTKDVGRAHRFAQHVEAGMVWVNSENVRHLPTPFGGMKSSGIGRDGGDYSFDFYMETKNIAIALDNHKIPKIGA